LRQAGAVQAETVPRAPVALNVLDERTGEYPAAYRLEAGDRFRSLQEERKPCRAARLFRLSDGAAKNGRAPDAGIDCAAGDPTSASKASPGRIDAAL